MFAVIESYVESKLDELNQSYDESVKINHITNDLQLTQIAASQADINWQVYLSEFEYTNEFESLGWFNATVRLDMFFLIAGKDNTTYKNKFDEYVYPLAKFFMSDMGSMDYSTGDNSNVNLFQVVSLGVSNADKFEEDYYQPAINMTIRGFDNSTNYISGTEDSQL
jgi:hypothetical protein